MLIGPEGFDDAGAMRSENGKVQLYTTDFFPPVVDDPAAYGAIAAANSLSDIYAMGGRPTAVLNIAGFPEEWSQDILQPIFKAAVDKVQESGAQWVGGHTVRAAEPFYGFAVFGEVDEDALFRNDGAQAGDRLWLTKPLGAGSITTAESRGTADPQRTAAAVHIMAELNAQAMEAAQAAQVRCATDVTGFGLLGHAWNLAKGSKVHMVFESRTLPLYDGVSDLAQEGVFSGGSKRGRASLEGRFSIAESVPDWLANIAFDAETSGGLLCAVPQEKEQDFLNAWKGERVLHRVGEVRSGEPQISLH